MTPQQVQQFREQQSRERAQQEYEEMRFQYQHSPISLRILEGILKDEIQKVTHPKWTSDPIYRATLVSSLRDFLQEVQSGTFQTQYDGNVFDANGGINWHP